ncbi:MAG: hypothetical protein J07HX64_00385 [halophilic archaeon J07HX64]|jgi:hypothetical protein|nr:MAG: hypothetical protein J07HX64_00385 [halophilic archaeon J07HX64]
MQQPQFVEQAEPEEVFGLLSDDNRVAILRALWNGDEPIGFSELHDAVDIGDSGQFNYHLKKLVDQFVTRAEEGYELTVAGDQINGAIESGSYTTSGRMEPIQLDSLCSCGGTRTFYYEDELATIECDSCSLTARYDIPPSVFADCDHEEVPTVAGRYLRTVIERLHHGFCPRCDGPAEHTACQFTDVPGWDEEEPEDNPLGNPRELPIVLHECRQCEHKITSGVQYSLLTHPVVVAFHYDHGIDIRDCSIWEFTSFMDRERVRSTDPFRASTVFTVDGDELTVVVDEEMRVVETIPDEAT